MCHEDSAGVLARSTPRKRYSREVESGSPSVDVSEFHFIFNFSAVYEIIVHTIHASRKTQTDTEQGYDEAR